MDPKNQTGSARNDRLLAEFENSSTPVAAMIGAIVGIAVPLTLVTAAIILVMRWSRPVGMALSVFILLGIVSASLALRSLLAKVALATIESSPTAIRQLIHVQIVQVVLFCVAGLVVFASLYITS